MAAATVYLEEYNGDSGVEIATSKQGGEIQFTAADSPTVEALETAENALVVPNSGVFRSYEKWLRVKIEALGDSAQVSNLELFVDGSTPNDGIAVWADARDNYATPKVGGYTASGAMVQPKVNLFDKDTNDPVVLGAGPYNAAASVGKYLVMQMEVYPSASTGKTSDYDLVLRYDEE